jgi:hypothetical protein
MEQKQVGCVEQSSRYSGAVRRELQVLTVNGRDMVRQGYSKLHVPETAVRRPSLLNAPTCLNSAQWQHYADGHVTSQLASDTQSKGPLASGTAPHRNLTSLCLTEQHEMKACG